MNRLIGLFDSGIGGFSVLQNIAKRHSAFSSIYLADTARCPFGSKSTSEIRQIAYEITKWLVSQKVEAIVVACNTTNAIALDIVKENSNVPVFDLISPVSRYLKESRVGILATPSTVFSGRYSQTIKKYNPFCFVKEEACPEFVQMIESGMIKSAELREKVALHLAPLLSEGIQSIVLGCSHYPVLIPILSEYIPSDIRIIDPSIHLAKEMDDFLSYNYENVDSSREISKVKFFTTSDPLEFADSIYSQLGILSNVQLISLISKSCVY